MSSPSSSEPHAVLCRSSTRPGAAKIAALCLLITCFGQAPVMSMETFDELSGMTLGAMDRPLAFVETGIDDLLAPDKQPNVLYVGPVEWDRSGDYTYLLWVQLAPGVDGHRIDDIRSPGAVGLTLDDGPVPLTAFEPPGKVGRPYALIEPEGQTAYFAVDVALLRRMAVSRRIVLNVRAGDLSMVAFVPRHDTRHTLQQYLVDRSIAAD